MVNMSTPRTLRSIRRRDFLKAMTACAATASVGGRLCSAFAAGANDKALILGGIPAKYHKKCDISSEAEFGAIKEKTGVTFELVTHDTIFEAYRKLPADKQKEARAIAGELIKGATQVKGLKQLDDSAVEKSARFYVAVRSLIEKAGASSAIISCSPYIRGAEMPTSCMALGLLQEDGIPAACQVDIDALLTMILFRRLVKMPSFMGNTFALDGKLGVQHCVTCRKMCGLDKKLYGYSISDYHGRKATPTIHAFLPEGKTVTVARLTRGLESLVLTTGTLVDCMDANISPDHPHRCRNAFIIKTDGLAKVMGTVAGRFQYHMIVAYGDHTEALSEFCKERGIGVPKME